MAATERVASVRVAAMVLADSRAMLMIYLKPKMDIGQVYPCCTPPQTPSLMGRGHPPDLMVSTRLTRSWQHHWHFNWLTEIFFCATATAFTAEVSETGPIITENSSIKPQSQREGTISNDPSSMVLQQWVSDWVWFNVPSDSLGQFGNGLQMTSIN